MIVSAIARNHAKLVAISVTMSDGVGAGDLISDIRGSSLNPPRILVGGAAFNRDPQLWRTVGADGFAADARSVLQLAHIQPGDPHRQQRPFPAVVAEAAASRRT